LLDYFITNNYITIKEILYKNFEKGGRSMKKMKLFLLTFLSLMFLLSSLYGFDSKFAQNITPVQAYHLLKTQPNTYLVDVRTQYEYQLIGHPNGAYNFPFMFLTSEFAKKGEKFANGKKTAPKTRYQFVLNRNFISELKKKFKTSDSLIFMCRSTKRSHKAADMAYKAGFKNSYNLLGGFEGYRFSGKKKEEKALAKMYSPMYGKPGLINGWKYYGLPYTYRMNPKYVYPPDLKK
jgi:rhodanese-related sulfurtransferase